MPTPFESFITGRQETRAATAAKQTGAFRGLQMEKIRSDMKASIRQAEQTQALSTAQEQYLTGDKAGATKAFAGLGKQGRTALKELGAIDEQRQEQQIASLVRGYQIMKTLPPEQQGQARQTLVASAVGSGLIKEDEADQLSFLAQKDPERFDDATAQMLGIEPELGAASGVISAKSPTGERRNFDLNDREDREEFIEGNWKELPEERLVGELPAGEETELRDFESTTDIFLARGQSILDLLAEAPEANTVTSTLERAGMNLMTEARQLSKDAGFSSVEAEIENYDAAGTTSFLEKQGITSARMQGQIVALAYMQAKIFDKGGRVTDKDFKFALKALGANNSNPKAFAATLKDQMRLAEKSFRQDYRRRRGFDYEGSFGTEEGGIPAPEGVAEGQQITQDGVLYVNRGGFMVPVQ